MGEEGKSLDVLGIKPISDAINTTVIKSFEAIEGFLKKVCLPLLDEVGLMLKDKMRLWRLNNIIKTLEKAQGKLEFRDDKLELKCQPRVAVSVIENASLIDNDEIQDLWAGLFASSCTKSGDDDSNLIFIDLLRQLTTAEAKIFKYACEKANKRVYANSLLGAEPVAITAEELMVISSIEELYHLDRELDHMRSLELIDPFMGGFKMQSPDKIADITPSALALNLYVRCQGFIDDPAKYWKLK
jgi:hypothetical protein